METVLNPPEVQISIGSALRELVAASINQKLILQGISWEMYERILSEFTDSNALHFAYDDGFLEIEMPLYQHERAIEVLGNLVTAICDEKKIDFINTGSTTFRLRAKAKGCEPDKSFYIQRENQIRGLLELDLTRDPSPDLVIEVDVTSPSLNKLPIYAALGVPEIWLYREGKVIFYKLYGETYSETSRSIALPFLDSQIANDLLQAGLTESSTQWRKRVREWIKTKD